MKGIFCLEGLWFGDQRDKTTILPVLELLEKYHDVEFRHHRCATKEEVLFSIKRWKLKSFNKRFPILYLAFHGKEYLIEIGNQSFTLDELADVLEDKCEGVIIHFGSCLTLKVDKRKLQSFLERTKALCILGYKEEVDFMKSTSLDLLIFHYIYDNNLSLTRSGMYKLENLIYLDNKKLSDELKFRIEINERSRLSRKNQK